MGGWSASAPLWQGILVNGTEQNGTERNGKERNGKERKLELGARAAHRGHVTGPLLTYGPLYSCRGRDTESSVIAHADEGIRCVFFKPLGPIPRSIPGPQEFQMLVCPTCSREHARLSSKPGLRGRRGPRTFIAWSTFVSCYLGIS